jgi:hypothetical protein
MVIDGALVPPARFTQCLLEIPSRRQFHDEIMFSEEM